MSWLRDERLIIWILAAAVLTGAVLNGLLGQVYQDGFPLSRFIIGFLIAFLGQVLIVALLLQLSVKRPRLGGVLMLGIFVVLAFITLPGYLTTYTWKFGEHTGAFVGNPHLLVLYLVAVILYAVSGILLLRAKPIE